MILLTSEKQCIYMYKGRRAAAEEEEVSLGVIMTNRNLPYFPYHRCRPPPFIHVYTLFFRSEKNHPEIVFC
jgi:hypothetical protein